MKKLIFLVLITLSQTLMAQNVGIGIVNPTRPLSFPPSLEKKISLYPGTSGDAGFGVFGNELRIHSDHVNADITFGYDNYSTGFSERMRIRNAGEMGMELNGRILLRNGTIPLNTAYGPGIWLTKADNSGVLGFMGVENNQNIGFYGGPAGWGFTYNTDQSRVGIGMTNPASTLDVRGTSTIVGRFVMTGPNSGFAIEGDCSNVLGQGIGVVGVGGGIGVAGSATVPGPGNRVGLTASAFYGTNYNFALKGNALGGIGAYGIYAEADGSGANWAGYFVGNVYASFYVGSDRKLKKDITSLTGALSIITQLNPSFYTFRTTEYKQMHLPEGIHYGLIADEVQQVMPGVVKKAIHPAQYENHTEWAGKKLTDEVVFNAVNYTEMIPVLIGAIKEQQVIITNQQKQIDELKKLVQQLISK